MLHQVDLQESSVAPSPIIPTCRLSPQLSKRGRSSMSIIPGGDIQPPGLSNMQNRSEHVPDLVQFFQAQDALSTTSSQSGSARDILKAGQRRLRQLAQRPKRGTDPQTKAEETSRQLLALQQEGFLPVTLTPPKPKKSAPKRSIDSTVSSTRSASNLSFQSSSRRDVESIGQPWLEGSLEKYDTREMKGGRLSSLDLRDITSLVGAALPRPPQFEDVTPPPYQASAQSSNHDSQGNSSHPSTCHTSNSTTSEPLDEIEALPKVPEIPDRTSSHHTRMSTSTLDNKQQSGHEQPAEAKPVGSKDGPEAADSKSSSSSPPNTMQSHSNPGAQTLKLFPDPVPPRMPNKGAWRISNGCPPPSVRSLPTTSAQQDSSAVSAQPNDKNTKPSSSTQNRDADPGNLGCVGQMPSTQPTDPSRNSVASQGHEKMPLTRNGRRPASLPMGAIDAFPLPAPMRPLPALPEAVPGIRPIYGQDTTATKRGLRVNQQQQILQLSSRSTAEGSMGSAARRDNHASVTGQATPSASKPVTATDRGNKSARAGASNSKSVTSVRASQSRADRVRALKKKDMSASRSHLQDSDNRSLEEGRQSLSRLSHTASSEKYDEATAASRCPDEGVGSQYERESTDTQLSTLSSYSSRFPGQSTEAHAVSTQDGSQLAYLNATSLNIHEPSSLPASKRNSRVNPGGGTRSTSVLSGRVVNDLDLHERSETPLPSSEDEGMDIGMRKQQAHPLPSRRRRPRLAPINVDESATRKTRHMKKSSSYDYSRPRTPRNRRSQGLEKSSSQSPRLQGSYYYHETRGGHHRPSYVRELEKRIVHLEHQNRTLQAALLGALGVGGKQNVEGLLGGSSTSLSTPPTSRSFSSMTDSPSSPDSHVMRNERRTHRRQAPYRPETWIASPGSSRRSSYSSEASADIRELENMIEDFDFGWESDQPSSRRTQQLEMRA
ncbi:hypothetical protein BDV27DRAFT_139705 [Aspergillus caelatus]|uniref:Uncharacterized protein n=1 Tax=Aspergillus caelatus TaxID=61420 RepID=A0A5N6ZHW2_9EURO|nr:uncharacterized protein BDV27DRAFT_139705 [Aspergillus caelatus]KAE8357247.1 hypothetical protein BDV27DRAFT_139705 [Aspergillus caelatus]